MKDNDIEIETKLAKTAVLDELDQTGQIRGPTLRSLLQLGETLNELVPGRAWVVNLRTDVVREDGRSAKARAAMAAIDQANHECVVAREGGDEAAAEALRDVTVQDVILQLTPDELAEIDWIPLGPLMAGG